MTVVNNAEDLACDQGLRFGRARSGEGARDRHVNSLAHQSKTRETGALSAKPRPFRACSQVTKDSGGIQWNSVEFSGRTVQNPLRA